MIQGSLSLVLPAHNEVENIEPAVNQALQVLPRFVREFEIIIVNDGSSDGTGEVAERLAEAHDLLHVVHHDANRGYGSAVRSGFSASTGDWVMLMDSDRQFDIGDLAYFEPFVGEYDMVAGYRMQRNDPAHRILFGQLFKLAMRVLFGMRVRDIDCAFKIMRGELLRSLDLQSPGALVSTELFVRWAGAGGTWTEVGVHHYPRSAGEQSGGSVPVIFRAMKETLVLWYRVNRESDQRSDREESGKANGVGPRDMTIITSFVLTGAGILARLFRRK